MFYKVGLPSCSVCRKPAAFEIRSSGNSRYGFACARHADAEIRRLEKAHGQPKQFEPAQHPKGMTP